MPGEGGGKQVDQSFVTLPGPQITPVLVVPTAQIDAVTTTPGSTGVVSTPNGAVAPVKFDPDTVDPEKLTVSLKTAFVKLAFTSVEVMNWAVAKRAPVKLAPVKSALWKLG